jgi:hypothetical protein
MWICCVSNADHALPSPGPEQCCGRYAYGDGNHGRHGGGDFGWYLGVTEGIMVALDPPG